MGEKERPFDVGPDSSVANLKQQGSTRMHRLESSIMLHNICRLTEQIICILGPVFKRAYTLYFLGRKEADMKFAPCHFSCIRLRKKSVVQRDNREQWRGIFIPHQHACARLQVADRTLLALEARRALMQIEAGAFSTPARTRH